MPQAFYHEQQVTIEGETLTLALNFRAIDSTEQLIGRNYDEVLKELQRDEAPVGLKGKFVWGLLREHHSEFNLDHILPLMRGDAGVTMGLAIEQLIHAAFPTAEEAKAENPPKRRGRSQTSEGNG